jgi:hypothetical protein
MALYDRIIPDRIALHERLMASLTPHEAETLVKSVEKLTRLLDRDETVVSAPVARAPAAPANRKR